MLVMEQSYTINYKIATIASLVQNALMLVCCVHAIYYSPISLQCLEAGMFSGYEYHSIASKHAMNDYDSVYDY